MKAARPGKWSVRVGKPVPFVHELCLPEAHERMFIFGEGRKCVTPTVLRFVCMATKELASSRVNNTPVPCGSSKIDDLRTRVGSFAGKNDTGAGIGGITNELNKEICHRSY